MTDRECSKCHEVKPLDAFTRRADTKSGFATLCKVCKAASKRGMPSRMKHQSPADVAARFWKKVRKTDGCWEWIGVRGRNGYGRFSFRGRMDMAHRVSLMIDGQDVPCRWTTGLVVDHICKNEGCVRPSHLRIVPQTENCTTLANATPFKRNRAATECVNGHPFDASNTAIMPERDGKPTRSCLTCNPAHWMYAVTERPPRPGSRVKAWRGPIVPPRVDDAGTVWMGHSQYSNEVKP